MANCVVCREDPADGLVPRMCAPCGEATAITADPGMCTVCGEQVATLPADFLTGLPVEGDSGPDRNRRATNLLFERRRAVRRRENGGRDLAIAEAGAFCTTCFIGAASMGLAEAKSSRAYMAYVVQQVDGLRRSLRRRGVVL